MKVLYLLRHAQAVWGGASVPDFERTLSEAGRREASAVGGLMRRRGARPGLVVSSPAARARETAALAVEGAGLESRVGFDPRVYEADSERLLAVVAGTRADADELLLVGHNPGVAELLARLSGERAGVPPGTLARVELGVGAWVEVADGCGRLAWLVTPGDAEEG